MSNGQNDSIFRGFHGRQQTWRTFKELLRYIRAQGLREGDRLPPQSDLRRLLKANNSTLSGAMAQLVRAGALTRKTRVGTVVADLAALPQVSWTVGVGSFPSVSEGRDSFFPDLLSRIQTCLARAGCQSLLFLRLQGGFMPVSADFFGLAEQVATNSLDGLMLLTPLSMPDWTKLVRDGVALCHTPIWLQAPCGVLIDGDELAERAVQMLHAGGCKRIAPVDFNDGVTGQPRFHAGYVRGLSLAGCSPQAPLSPAPGSLEGGRQLARTLLELPARSRPDGLIIFDDYVAMGLTEGLAAAGSYRPQIVAQTNRQLPVSFHLPVIAFEVDLDQLAQRSVSLLLERVNNPAIPERVERLAPQLAADTSPPALPARAKST